MEKEKQITVQKNSYWLSEIGFLFFKYQIGYEVYDYSKEANLVQEGVDLIVLNKQNLATYIICLGNDEPFDKLFIPISQNNKPSRLTESKADYVLFYDIQQDTVSLLELQLLHERVDYNFKNYKIVNKNNLSGIEVSKEDDILTDFINNYELNSLVSSKAKQIYNFRSKEGNLPLSR